MIKSIQFHIDSLNFEEVKTYINDENAELNEVAKCLCGNIWTILQNILHKCAPQRKKNDTSVLEQLCNEIATDKTKTILFYLKDFIVLLHSVLLRFDKIEINTLKELYHIFFILTFQITVYYDEKNFLQKILITLIQILNTNKSDCTQLIEIKKQIVTFYCFLHITDLIFFNALLIYLLTDNEYNDNTNHHTSSSKKTATPTATATTAAKQKKTLYILNEINNFFDILVKNEVSNNDNYAKERQVGDMPKTEMKTKMETIEKNKIKNRTIVQFITDTIQKRNIRAVFKKLKYHFFYSDIQVANYMNDISLNIRSHSVPEWSAVYDIQNSNYQSENININRFLLLLKILSPPFVDWSIKQKRNVENKNTPSDKHSLYYIYIMEEIESKNYLRETKECCLFFFFILLASYTNERAKKKGVDEFQCIFNKTVHTFFILLCEMFEYPFKEIKEKCTYNKEQICFLINGTSGNTTEDVKQKQSPAKKSNGMNTTEEENDHSNFHFCDLLIAKIIKTPTNFLMKLKNLAICGDVPTEPLLKLHIHNNGYLCMINKEERMKKKYISAFTKAENNEYCFTDEINTKSAKKSVKYKKKLLFYDHDLFQRTYELKTRKYKYVNFFSNSIAQLIINGIHLLISFFNQFQLSTEIITNEGLDEIDASTYSFKLDNWDTTKEKSEYTTKEKNNLEQIGTSILQNYYYMQRNPLSETTENFVVELLYICCMFFEYPVKKIQNNSVLCFSPIMKRINIRKYQQYFCTKANALLNILREDTNISDVMIETYVLLKCKITKNVNIQFVKNIENLLDMAVLKKSDKVLCSLIGTHLLKCFFYHPTIICLILYKYINFLFYLMECNNVEVVYTSLKCLFILFHINAEEMTNYVDDTVYRLHLLFNVFYQNTSPSNDSANYLGDDSFDYPINNFISNSKTDNNAINNSNNNNETSPEEIHSILKNCFFKKNNVYKYREQMVTLIKLVIYSIRKSIPKEQYMQLLRIFEKYPKQFSAYSKHFQLILQL